MSTLKLAPDEFDLVRRAAAILADAGVPRWPSPAELREFLSDHVTVVKPGETLVLRLSHELSARQCQEIVTLLDDCTDSGYIPFRVLCVPMTESFAVVQADGEVP